MKAIVLSAGYGTRLGELTREIPKPMLSIAGKPLLEYMLGYLRHNNFDEIAINLHYKPELIQNYFGDGAAWGVKIYYAYEENLLGTAGAVRNFASFLGDTEDFLVIYGDLLLDQDLALLQQVHREKRAIATLLVHQRLNSNSLIKMDEDNRIVAFLERPSEEEKKATPYPWVNSVVQMLNRRILHYIPEHQPSDLPRDIYMSIISRERLYGVPLTSYRCAIDSPIRYEEAQQAVLSRKCKVFL